MLRPARRETDEQLYPGSLTLPGHWSMPGMNKNKPLFWAALAGGILVFITVNLLNDIPYRIERGEQAQRAGRILHDLRDPLLTIEYAERSFVAGQGGSSDPARFEAAVIRMKQLTESYRDAADYNPLVEKKVEAFAKTIDDWIAREAAERLPENQPFPPADGDSNERDDFRRLLRALVALDEAEAIIRRDILDGYSAVRLLQSSGAILTVYLLFLLLLLQYLRTKQLRHSLAERQQAQQAFDESRQRLALILDSIPVRVFWKDRNSVYLGCNRSFADDAGLESPQQIIGRDDYSLGWHDQAELYRSDDHKVVREGVAMINYEEPQTSPNGESLILRTSKVPLRDLAGNIIGVLGCYENITERKQEEQELEAHRGLLEELVRERTREVQLQAKIIDQIHDSVVSTDLDGVVTSWNKGAERLFGYSAREAKGRHISFVYPEEQHEFLQQQVITPLKDRGEHETEVVMRRKDGTDFHAQLSLSMLLGEEGSPVGMTGYSIDISRRKEAEAALRKQTKILESANRELEAFSYSVSHDLRSPLRAVDGFSQLLLEDYAANLDDTGKDYLNRVRKGAQRMASLIDDLLELSRVSRQDLRRDMVDLSGLAHSIVGKLRESEPDRSVSVVIEPGLKARCDMRLIEMALANLFGNAWKYTSRVAKAEIEFGLQRTGAESVYYLRDNGAGFDMDYADKLFGTFQRLHGSEFEGTGIGLATVQRIIKRHGGRVWGEGEKDRGASFYFTLGDA
jgi:PAS domain S-box-containing protein